MYQKIVRPALFSLSRRDPERAHEFVYRRLIWLGSHRILLRLLERRYLHQDARLEQEVFGLRFPNPVGMAAGFDKYALIHPVLQAFGFGFVEVGGITYEAQAGNPRPRILRLERDRCLINRMGFNNDGAAMTQQRLRLFPKLRVPLGINIGKSRSVPVDDLDRVIEDYLATLRILHADCDFVVINPSSPNTPGLRQLQKKEHLSLLLEAIMNDLDRYDIGKPVLVKLSPDLTESELDQALEVCVEQRLSGIVAANTTTSRAGLSSAVDFEGGLSGPPLFDRAVAMVKRIVAKTEGRLPVIGVGGISSPHDAAVMLLDAGATLVQIFTALIYQGPGLVKAINRSLSQHCDRFDHISLGGLRESSKRSG